MVKYRGVEKLFFDNNMIFYIEGQSMPHFRYIKEGKCSPLNELLMRARIHIRSGKRRLREGKISLGILTIYDCLNSALQWYISFPENIKRLQVTRTDILKNDSNVFRILNNAGVIDDRVRYEDIDRLVEMALKEDMTEYNYEPIVSDIEHVLRQLGVMPFNEEELPPDIDP